MDTLAAIARQRAVMDTVADLIVVAAAGKTLRVAIGCTHPDEAAFADQLTRALHARGRPSHCLAPKAKPLTSDGCMPAGSPTVAVITGRAPASDENDLCRINIQLHTYTEVTASVAAANRELDGQDRCNLDGQEPDIIVDYLDPGGAAIHHIGPALTPLSRPSPCQFAIGSEWPPP